MSDEIEKKKQELLAAIDEIIAAQSSFEVTRISQKALKITEELKRLKLEKEASESHLQKGWLEEQLRKVENDVRKWPKWMLEATSIKIDDLPPMKELIFSEGLMMPVLNGKKKITIRKYRQNAHNFIKSEIVKGIFKDGLNIFLEITKDTEIKDFADLTDEEVREDGFKHANNAMYSLKKYYPDLELSDKAAIIRFKVFEVADIPVIVTNIYSKAYKAVSK